MFSLKFVDAWHCIKFFNHRTHYPLCFPFWNTEHGIMQNAEVE